MVGYPVFDPFELALHPALLTRKQLREASGRKDILQSYLGRGIEQWTILCCRVREREIPVQRLIGGGAGRKAGFFSGAMRIAKTGSRPQITTVHEESTKMMYSR